MSHTEAHARATDPETSHAAAASVEPTELELLVLAALGVRPRGCTSSELSDFLGIERVSVSPRLAPLARKGLIEASGERRRGPSGRSQIVWKASSIHQR